MKGLLLMAVFLAGAASNVSTQSDKLQQRINDLKAQIHTLEKQPNNESSREHIRALRQQLQNAHITIDLESKIANLKARINELRIGSDVKANRALMKDLEYELYIAEEAHKKSMGHIGLSHHRALHGAILRNRAKLRDQNWTREHPEQAEELRQIQLRLKSMRDKLLSK